MALLRRIPFTLRIPLLAAALMVVVGLVASQQVLATLNRLQEARIRELGKLHVEALSVAVGPQVLRKDVWEVYDALKRAKGEGEGRRIAFTAVADEAGRVIAATDPVRAPIDAAVAALAAGAEPPDNLSLSSDVPTLKLVAPLVYQGREVGTILTEIDVADLIAERRRASRLLVLGNVAATAVLAILGYLVMRRMLRPITRLAQRMSATAEAPERVPESDIPRGDTELSRLIQTYNAMADAVEAKRETERRLAERERLVSLGRLSLSLAHEINNPLGGLINAADTIRTYADRPEVVRGSADLLTRGLDHLRDVMRATLEQNRVDRSATALGPKDLEDLRFLIGPEIKRQSQRLDWRVEAEEPSLEPFAAGPVRQIVLNLLLNASAAAGKGGCVRFECVATAAGLRLEVADDGPGPTPEVRARLMSSAPVSPGGGVGLRLVRDLARELGGEVAVERRGAETVITVSLPLASAQPGAAAC